MLSVPTSVSLLRYKAWTHQQLYTALTQLPEAILTAEQKIVFGSILRMLNHVLTIDIVWQSHLCGVDHGITTRNPDQCPPFAEIRVSQPQLDQWFIDYTKGLAFDQQSEVVDFSFIDGGVGRMTHADILMHVVNHSTYHRGHVAAMLYAADVVPPSTDLPVFLQTS